MALSTDEATARTIAAILLAGRPQEDQEDAKVVIEYVKKARKLVSANIPGSLP